MLNGVWESDLGLESRSIQVDVQAQQAVVWYSVQGWSQAG